MHKHSAGGTADVLERCVVVWGDMVETSEKMSEVSYISYIYILTSYELYACILSFSTSMPVHMVDCYLFLFIGTEMRINAIHNDR